MSQLTIYRETDSHSECEPAAAVTLRFDEGHAFEPKVYSFRDAAERVRVRHRNRAADRARLMAKNQTCPVCSRCAIDSIELQDGQIGRSGAVIPGTGTLVGFSCHTCGHEWPV